MTHYVHSHEAKDSYLSRELIPLDESLGKSLDENKSRDIYMKEWTSLSKFVIMSVYIWHCGWIPSFDTAAYIALFIALSSLSSQLVKQKNRSCSNAILGQYQNMSQTGVSDSQFYHCKSILHLPYMLSWRGTFLPHQGTAVDSVNTQSTFSNVRLSFLMESI